MVSLCGLCRQDDAHADRSHADRSLELPRQIWVGTHQHRQSCRALIDFAEPARNLGKATDWVPNKECLFLAGFGRACEQDRSDRDGRGATEYSCPGVATVGQAGGGCCPDAVNPSAGHVQRIAGLQNVSTNRPVKTRRP